MEGHTQDFPGKRKCAYVILMHLETSRVHTSFNALNPGNDRKVLLDLSADHLIPVIYHYINTDVSEFKKTSSKPRSFKSDVSNMR